MLAQFYAQSQKNDLTKEDAWKLWDTVFYDPEIWAGPGICYNTRHVLNETFKLLCRNFGDHSSTPNDVLDKFQDPAFQEALKRLSKNRMTLLATAQDYKAIRAFDDSYREGVSVEEFKQAYSTLKAASPDAAYLLAFVVGNRFELDPTQGENYLLQVISSENLREVYDIAHALASNRIEDVVIFDSEEHIPPAENAELHDWVAEGEISGGEEDDIFPMLDQVQQSGPNDDHEGDEGDDDHAGIGLPR